MSLSTMCPRCSATFPLPEGLAGKPARCSRCQHEFTALATPLLDPIGPAPAPRPPRRDASMRFMFAIGLGVFLLMAGVLLIGGIQLSKSVRRDTGGDTPPELPNQVDPVEVLAEVALPLAEHAPEPGRRTPIYLTIKGDWNAVEFRDAVQTKLDRLVVGQLAPVVLRVDKDTDSGVVYRAARICREQGAFEVKLQVLRQAEPPLTGDLDVELAEWRRPETLLATGVQVRTIRDGVNDGDISSLVVEGPQGERVVANLQDLEAELRARGGDVRVTAESRLKHQALVQVMDTGRKVGTVYLGRPPDDEVLPPHRLPALDADEQAQIMQDVRDIYREHLRKTKPAERLALVQLLRLAARHCEDDQRVPFVLLREAADQAVLADDLPLSLECIHELLQRFEGDALAIQFGILERGQPSKLIAERAFKLAGDAAMLDQPAMSDKFLKLAESLAVRLGDAELRQRIQARLAEPDRPRQVAAWNERIKKDPKDAEANLLLGKHHFFDLQERAKGLALLAKGNDDALGELARKELAKPKDAEHQVELADGWWGLAEKSQDLERRAMILAARRWYQQAQPSAPEPAQARIADRLKESERTIGVFPGGWGGRAPERRTKLLEANGGNTRSEAAAAAGLKWIVRHQASDGHWGLHDFTAHGRCECGNPGSAGREIGATSLALLALLGGDHDHRQSDKLHPYPKNVERALKWLIVQQDTDGTMARDGYEQAMATQALCEAFALTADPMLKGPAQRALDRCVAWQHKEGGFRYKPGEAGDTSVTGWFTQALASGKMAGLDVPEKTWKGLAGHLDRVGTERGDAYGYQQPNPAPAMTAVGLLGRQYLGWGPLNPGLFMGVQYLEKVPPGAIQNIYFYYHATQVVHRFGGEPWDRWNPKMRDLLIDSQDQGLDAEHRDQKGSWSPAGDAWGGQLGRLGHTALAVMTLEVYYRYLP